MSIESCTDFQELPEGCIANVLSLTSLNDVCRLSLVNSTFRSAAESDTIWEMFLPHDYRHIISRSIEGADSILAKFRTKKELYRYLCHNHILIDGGTKSFSLDKRTGKKCFMLASRDLFIVMGDAPEFCKWISYPNSRFRFPEVAELLSVGRFEIRGKINTGMLSSGTKYAAYIVFTSRSRIEGFKFQRSQALIQIGQETKLRIVCIDPDEERRQRCMTVPRPTFPMRQMLSLIVDNMPTKPNTKYPKLRGDGWLEVELGEFFVEEKQDRDVKIILKELKRGIWKSSLIIQGIEIRPRAA